MKRICSCRLGLAALLLALSGTGSGAAAQGDFSQASLSGRYAGIFSGRVPRGGGSLPIVGTGIFIADGKGHLRGRESYTLGTTTCEATISGTYKVGPDGRGTDAVTFTTLGKGCASGSFTQSFVIARHGALVLLANTNGQQIEERWHLQR